MTSAPFNQAKIKKELKIHAKALDIPPGAANDFIDRAIAAATSSLAPRKIITDDDLTRALVKELKKYHQDFAYVYENHDKII